MDKKISVKVCLGTTCFVMGSANLQELIEMVPKITSKKLMFQAFMAWGCAHLTVNFQKHLM